MQKNLLTYPVSDENLSGLVKKVSDEHTRYVITVKGQSKAVLLSFEEYENLREELEILSQNPEFFKERERAHQDLKVGQTTSLDGLNQELGLCK